MVVAGILALALALPTGALFGIGYGTGVRIGYEQIYPLLFPANTDGTRDTSSVSANIKAINDIYNAIGGKEASNMGIAVGLSNAMSELDTNPDFLALLKLESSLSGSTSLNLDRTRYGLDDLTSVESGSALSEVEQFNLDNQSAKWIRYRSYTIQQLQNIISSSTNQESIDIATKVLNEKFQENVGTGDTTLVSPEQKTAEGELAPAFTKTLEDAQAFTAWQNILINLKNEWIQVNSWKILRCSPSSSQYQGVNTCNRHTDNLTIISNKIRTISLDYRNPNEGIRQGVLPHSQKVRA